MLVEGTIIDRYFLAVNDYCYEVETETETLEVRGKGNRNVGDYVCEHAEENRGSLSFNA